MGGVTPQAVCESKEILAQKHSNSAKGSTITYSHVIFFTSERLISTGGTDNQLQCGFGKLKRWALSPSHHPQRRRTGAVEDDAPLQR